MAEHWRRDLYDAAADEIIFLIDTECWKDYRASPFYTTLSTDELSESRAETKEKERSPPLNHR